jgi:hypothetical protein
MFLGEIFFLMLKKAYQLIAESENEPEPAF